MSHLDSAHNLARWLTRNPDDANDVVQEAYARALRYASGFRGGDAKAWLLTIVRNTAYRWLGHGRRSGCVEPFDEEAHSDPGSTSDPEQQLMRRSEGELAAAALAALPARFREILVLREFEDSPTENCPTCSTCRSAPSCLHYPAHGIGCGRRRQRCWRRG